MQEHKFQIGQTVYFTSRPIGHMVANSTYEVVKLLPSDGADYQYRIKNANEAFERVARESQLEFSRLISSTVPSRNAFSKAGAGFAHAVARAQSAQIRDQAGRAPLVRAGRGSMAKSRAPGGGGHRRPH